MMGDFCHFRHYTRAIGFKIAYYGKIFSIATI
jgi:hypothetical protein